MTSWTRPGFSEYGGNAERSALLLTLPQLRDMF
jgi:hypothetical protein